MMKAKYYDSSRYTSAKPVLPYGNTDTGERERVALNNTVKLYRQNLRDVLRHTGSWFNRIKALFTPVISYDKLPSQFGALERLIEALVDSGKYKIESIFRAGSYDDNNFLISVAMVSVNSLPSYYEITLGISPVQLKLVDSPVLSIPPATPLRAEPLAKLLNAKQRYVSDNHNDSDYWETPEGFFYHIV